ncbi:hypothetical protein DM02DRAFT_178606 [Periconia macrospinosa]|uniref:Uncharacterized protein n=1 Tax=Periconia macrospinosa TaxID=97972 RepID=A0A2V1E1M5_9PLEO|nr:hypothetical protein DM02DRAFT_178606 [Periconia macrospinosa]
MVPGTCLPIFHSNSPYLGNISLFLSILRYLPMLFYARSFIHCYWHGRRRVDGFACKNGQGG